MTLDEQLKNWREATETLEPSETLMASLHPSGLTTVVKVLIVTALVGAIATGYSVVRALNLSWSGSSAPVTATSCLGKVSLCDAASKLLRGTFVTGDQQAVSLVAGETLASEVGDPYCAALIHVDEVK